MDKRIATALTLGMVLGAGGSVATRDGSVAGAIDGAEVALYEDRIQFLADGGCSVYVQAKHLPAKGLAVAHKANEYPLKSCPNCPGCYELRTQFLADGGCAVYSTGPSGQTPEVGQPASVCAVAKTRAAKVAMRDFEKSSEAP